MSPADAVLLERWQRRRDADAFTELVQRYSGMVFGSCKRVLHNPAQAEDVAQECFIELMQTRARIRVSLGAWLHTMAVRRSLDRLKGEHRRRKREAHFAEAHPEAQEAADASLDEILACVDEAIEGLPPRLRAVIVARFLEGRPHTAVARQLGVAESTVRYRVDQGIERIRKALERQGIVTAAAALVAALERPAEAAPTPLVVRLGKLGLSGSVPVANTAALTLLSGKLVVLVAAAVLAGAGLWLGSSMLRGAAAPERPETAQHSAATPAAKAESEKKPVDEPTPAPAVAAEPAPSNAAAAPEDFSIQGRVYDAETGAGIAGVRAHVYPSGGGPYLADSETTGSDGRYTIPPLQDGAVTVSLLAIAEYPDPRSGRRVTVTLQDGVPVTGVDFALTKGLIAAGTVLDTGGKPVEGATVGATAPTVPNPVKTESDQEGRFVLHLPSSTDNLMIQAQSPSFESLTQAGLTLTNDGLEGISLVLDRPRTGSVAGVVMDPQATGVEGAHIFLLHKTQRVFVHAGTTEADAQGAFRIQGCEPGDYAVIVTAPQAQGFSTSEEYARLTLAPGEAVEGLELVYGEKGGLAIAGHVRNAAGKAVRGVTVSCYGDTLERAYTERDGSFVITGLKEREYGLEVEHHDYSVQRLTIPAGTLDVEITLQERGRLEGRVLRADTATPMQAFTYSCIVGAARSFDSGLFAGHHFVASADGTFVVSELNAGPLSVAAWAPGFAPAWKTLTIEEGASSQVELHLEPVPPVEGWVVDEAGNPVAGAGVYFVEGVSMNQMDRAVATRTNAEGYFVLESLPPDTKRLCAFQAAYGIGVVDLPGDNRIVLPSPATIDGVIEIDGVSPFRDMAVNTRYVDARYLPSGYMQPNDDGTFRLTGLAPGHLEVNVHPMGGSAHRVKKTIAVESGKTIQQRFVFESGTGVIEGTLLAGGEPVREARMSLERPSDDVAQYLRIRSEPSGSFRFENVWAGDLLLTVTRATPDSPSGPVRDEVLLTLEEGQVLQEDIELTPLP